MPAEKQPGRPGLQLRALRWRLFAAAYTGHTDDAVDALQQLERAAAGAAAGAADDAADDADDADDADARLVAATRAVHGGHASTAIAVLTAAGPVQRCSRGNGMPIKVFLTTAVTSRRIDANDAASLIRIAVARHEDEVTVDDVDGLLSVAIVHGKHLVAEALAETFCEQALR